MPRVLVKEGVYKKPGTKCYYMAIRVDDDTVVNRSTGMRTKKAAIPVYWATRERLVKEALNIHAEKTPRDILPLWKEMAVTKFGSKYIEATEDAQQRHWHSLMDMPVARITQEEVQAIEVQIRELGFMPESINKAINAFSCLITFGCKKLKWFHYTEFSFSREKVRPTTKDVIGKQHLIAFLGFVASKGNIQALLIIAMMLALALRECEAIAACWSSFSIGADGQMTFRTTSKNRTRVVPVPEWLELMLRHYEDAVLDPNYRPSRRAGRPRSSVQGKALGRTEESSEHRDLMFTGPSGKPRAAGYTSEYIKFACDKLGLPALTPHRMRGSSANMMKVQGLSIDEIQQVLGHSSIVTTSLYLSQNHAITRDVQNSIGRQTFPGASSALDTLRESASSRTRRLLPMPVQALAQVTTEVFAIDSPAMRFLPPLTPLPTPHEPTPATLDAEHDKSAFVAGVEQLQMIRRPSRPPKELLEDLVWRIPTSTLAKIFGVSDVAIAKWCAELGIVKPGRGFWAKAASLLERLRLEFGSCPESL